MPTRKIKKQILMSIDELVHRNPWGDFFLYHPPKVHKEKKDART